jgi:hypothetical protein
MRLEAHPENAEIDSPFSKIDGRSLRVDGCGPLDFASDGAA